MGNLKLDGVMTEKNEINCSTVLSDYHSLFYESLVVNPYSNSSDSQFNGSFSYFNDVNNNFSTIEVVSTYENLYSTEEDSNNSKYSWNQEIDYYKSALHLNCSDVRDFNCSETNYICQCFRLYIFHSCNETLLKISPQYFSYLYRFIGSFFQGLVLLFGVLGNVMIVVVVGINKTMITPTNCYLVSLAVADFAVLVSAVPQEILSYYLITGHWIWGDVGCAGMIFTQHLGINASSLSLAAFTVERYIAICHPMKAQVICTVARARKIVAAVWIFAILYCFPWLFLTAVIDLNYDVDYETRHCTFRLSREQYLTYYLIDIIIFYIIPLVSSCVLYTMIAKILYKPSAVPDGMISYGRTQVPLRQANVARQQVVQMLVVVVIVFAVLWLPYRGMLVLNSFLAYYGKETFLDYWYLLFAKTCIFINSAINPILYNVLSTKFRTAFQRMICCREDEPQITPAIRMQAFTSNKRTRNLRVDFNPTTYTDSNSEPSQSKRSDQDYRTTNDQENKQRKKIRFADSEEMFDGFSDLGKLVKPGLAVSEPSKCLVDESCSIKVIIHAV